MERRVAAEHVERVAPRKPVTRPRDGRRADGAVREPQHDRRRVLDVAALARALRERIRARGRLHRDDLAGDRTLEIDAVARALEQVAATLGAVEKPGSALRRARTDADQQAELLPLERLPQVVEHVDAAPLIADGAHGVAAFRGFHDRPRVVQPARDRLLEIHVDAPRECLDGRIAVQLRRRADEDGIRRLAVEQLAPVRVHGARVC